MKMSLGLNKGRILALTVIAVLAVRFWFAFLDANRLDVAGLYGEFAVLRGTIDGFPEVSGTERRFSVEDVSRLVFGQEVLVKGKVNVFSNGSEVVHYGDRVELKGVLKEPYSRDPRVAADMKDPGIRVTGATRTAFLFRGIEILREVISGRLNTAFPEPEAGLAKGILLGGGRLVAKNVTDDFRRAGLTHILAVSGYNIVIMIVFMENLFYLFRRPTATAIALGVISVFVLLAGASASVVRAGIMGILGLLARLFGRPGTSLRALVISAIIMIALDPLILLYDIGFQLSFSAAAGLILFGTKIKEKLTLLPERFGIREGTATTLAAQVFTLPIIIYYFGGISLIAPVSNILILPFIPLLMLGSFLSIFFGKIAAAPFFVLFEILLFIIHLLASVPFGFIDVGI